MKNFSKEDQIELLQMAAKAVEENAEAIINKGLTTGVTRYCVSIELDLSDGPQIPEISVSYDMLPNSEQINEWVQHNIAQTENIPMEV